MSVANDLLERLEQLKQHRHNFDTTWQEIADIVHPMGGDYNQKHSAGEKKTERMYEMTAANSLEKFTAAMEAFLTPRTQRWHHLRATDENLDDVIAVREWFDKAEDVLFRIRNAPTARFYGQIYESYKSLGLIGNGCLFVDENPRGGVRYRYTHAGTTWIETNYEGIVDTVYHEYELSARAAIQKWGDDAPKCAKTAEGSSPTQKHKYLHVVRPNENRDRERRDAKGKAFESFEISVVDRDVIGKPGGYEEMPYIWTRYMVNPTEMYGRGPCMLVLPDIKTLQEMQKTFMRAGHKVADPPLLVAHDGKLGRGAKKIRISPGGLNFGAVDPTSGKPLIQPLQTGARLDLTEGMQETMRANIREALLVNLFDLLIQDRVTMTATEVLERAKEKGQLLTPIIGRQQSELLGPLIERELGIAMRQGILPPLPQELIEAEGEYEIEYESDATRMQRSDEVAAFMRLQEVMAPFIQANPQLLDKIDADEAMEHYGHDLGVPSKLFRDEQEMAQIRAQQAQEAQAAQVAEQAPGVARAVRDISEVA